MANNRLRVSPSLNFSEKDISFTPQRAVIGNTRLMVMGEFEYGSAFTIESFNNYNQFKAKFGGLNPCKYKNTNQLKFQGAYTAKEFLKEGTELYVCRVLGLSGYDAGDLWGIKVGGAMDTSTIVDGTAQSFTGELQYASGVLTNATFSNTLMQDLYDEGVLTAAMFNGAAAQTGDTFSYLSRGAYMSDCNGNFSGTKFTGVVTEREESFICLTGTTSSTGYVLQSSLTDTCSVDFGVGTQTVGATLRITVSDAILIVNQTTSDVTIVSVGLIVVNGGTITHNTDSSITVVSGTITLPNGDVLNGGTYKICDLGANVVEYDCDGISGTGYTIVTGTTVAYTYVLQSESSPTEVQLPSGLVTITLTGTATNYTADSFAQYDDLLVCALRSKATYNGNEELFFKIKDTNLTVAPMTVGAKIKPYDDFKVSGFDSRGVAFEYVVTLDKRKSNYINKVFGSRPNCCENPAPLYVSESYQVMFDNLVAQGKIDCIKPSMCHSTNLWNYKQPYTGAETPYIVSELRGSKVVRLFKFKTLGDGDSSNRQIKVSVTNIRPDKRQFDVIVRAYNDTDKSPVVLEQFSNCTLDVQSNNYIARLIGDNVTYPQKSSYLYVEMAAECVFDAFPCGFEGYPVVDYGSCLKAPSIQYKTFYAPTDRVRNEYLGLNSSDGYDQDMFDYHGMPYTDVLVFSSETHGFHLDKLAGSVLVDDVQTKTFDVGIDEFKNEADLAGTSYEKLAARKFTLAFYGGFDGWDIHRMNTGNRTIGDEYSVNGTKGLLGLQSHAFDSVVLEDTDGTVLDVINSDYYAYLKGIKTISNPESVKYNLLVTPNLNTLDTSDLVEETIDMLENDRCDAFYIIDTPTRDAEGVPLSPKTIVSRLDGLYSTSFGATYAYDGIYNDTENNIYVTVPPSVDLPRVYAVSDKVGQVWFAPAGKNRGGMVYTNVVKNPNIDERDILYDGRVNSLWRDAGIVTAWGNKTLQEEETALDRINVRRLMIYIRQAIADVSVKLLFEQNDETVRRQFSALVNPILSEIRTNRGISDFRIELDSSQDSLDRGELNGRILIKPIKSLEFINISFVLTPQGASFDNV